MFPKIIREEIKVLKTYTSKVAIKLISRDSKILLYTK
jgi:hypothetical protein